MIKLFSEKVVDTFTSSNLNIIQVEDFVEVFFDVYEIEINGNKYIAEKIGDYHGSPVVNVPIVEDSNKLEAPFILKRGEFEVYYNPRNSKFLETITETTSHELELPNIVETIKEEPVVIAEKKDKILEDINIAKRKAIEEAQGEKERLLKEAVDEIKIKNDFIKSEVDTIKKDLVNDFYSETVNAKEELSAYNEKKEVELTNFVKVIVKDKLKALQDKINTSSDLTKANLTKDVEQLAESLKLTLNSNQENISRSVVSLVREEFEKVVKVVDHAIDKKSKILDTKLYGQVQRQRNELLALEKANIELNDNINKANSKALSRIGNVKKELEDSLLQAETRVKDFYGTRIKSIEEGLFEGSKDEILKIVRESRESILEEIINVKTDIPAIAEARSNVNTIKKDIEKAVSERFTNEMMSIKRLIEMSSGGGSVAVQYANGGTMNGDLNVTSNILSGGVNLNQLFGSGGGGGTGTIAGSGTSGNITLWDSISSITDSIMSQTSEGIVIDGDITGGSAVFSSVSALTANFLQTVVSTTSALSVVNNGTGPALYVQQDGNEPIAHFIDKTGDDIVFADNGYVGIGTFEPAEKLTVSGNISANGQLTVTGNISADGNVYSTNVNNITNRVDSLYSYLIQNFDSNTVTVASSITDFVNNYSKAGITTGDVVTLSAINTSYLLGNSDGSSVNHWYEVNLKPNFIFYKANLNAYSVLDTFPLSEAKSAKYIIQVEDTSDNAIFYGEINVISDGTIAVASEYALNHTTVFPFVEFGASVVNGTHVSLSAIPLDGKTMNNFIFKSNRSNLFG
tara:strand:+ start:1838 stop:4237 length:2400 start_codon:yes stop_codon:yes gene_type:complete